VTDARRLLFREERQRIDLSKASQRLKHLGLLVTFTALGLLRLLARVLALRAGLVHLVEQAQASVLEVIGLLLNLGRGSSALACLALGDELAHGSDLLLNLLGLGLVEAVLELLESLLSVVDDAVGAVGSLNSVLALFVRLGVLLGITDHGLNLSVGQTGTGSNGDGLVLVGRLVLGVDVDD
jgi:hypothetical protein